MDAVRLKAPYCHAALGLGSSESDSVKLSGCTCYVAAADCLVGRGNEKDFEHDWLLQRTSRKTARAGRDLLPRSAGSGMSFQGAASLEAEAAKPVEGLPNAAVIEGQARFRPVLTMLRAGVPIKACVTSMRVVHRVQFSDADIDLFSAYALALSGAPTGAQADSLEARPTASASSQAAMSERILENTSTAVAETPAARTFAPMTDAQLMHFANMLRRGVPVPAVRMRMLTHGLFEEDLTRVVQEAERLKQEAGAPVPNSKTDAPATSTGASLQKVGEVLSAAREIDLQPFLRDMIAEKRMVKGSTVSSSPSELADWFGFDPEDRAWDWRLAESMQQQQQQQQQGPLVASSSVASSGNENTLTQDAVKMMATLLFFDTASLPPGPGDYPASSSTTGRSILNDHAVALDGLLGCALDETLSPSTESARGLLRQARDWLRQARSADSTALLAELICQSIRDLFASSRATLVLPLGCAAPESRNYFVLVLTRTSEQRVTVTVIPDGAAGSGIDYHPTIVVYAPAIKVKYACGLSLHNVRAARVAHPSFAAALANLALSEQHYCSVGVLYQVLLPFLNEARPLTAMESVLLAEAKDGEGAGGFCTPRRARSSAFSSVLRSLRFLVCAVTGGTLADFKSYKVLLRKATKRAALKVLDLDLDAQAWIGQLESFAHKRASFQQAQDLTEATPSVLDRVLARERATRAGRFLPIEQWTPPGAMTLIDTIFESDEDLLVILRNTVAALTAEREPSVTLSLVDALVQAPRFSRFLGLAAPDPVVVGEDNANRPPLGWKSNVTRLALSLAQTYLWASIQKDISDGPPNGSLFRALQESLTCSSRAVTLAALVTCTTAALLRPEQPDDTAVVRALALELRKSAVDMSLLSRISLDRATATCACAAEVSLLRATIVRQCALREAAVGPAILFDMKRLNVRFTRADDDPTLMSALRIRNAALDATALGAAKALCADYDDTFAHFRDLVLLFKWGACHFGLARRVDHPLTVAPLPSKLKPSWSAHTVKGEVQIFVSVAGEEAVPDGLLQGRVPDAMANARRFIPSPLNQGFPTLVQEEHVLYAPELPLFDSNTSSDEAERLLCYLTEPNARIPALLSFFAEDRVSLLFNESLAVMLEASLAQPELLVSNAGATSFAEIPVPLAAQTPRTACLLQDELLSEPFIIVGYLVSICQDALSLVQGTVSLEAGYPPVPSLRVLQTVVALLTTAERLGRNLRVPGASDHSALVAALDSLASSLRGTLLSCLEAWVSEARLRVGSPKNSSSAKQALVFLADLCSQTFSSAPEELWASRAVDLITWSTIRVFASETVGFSEPAVKGSAYNKLFSHHQALLKAKLSDDDLAWLPDAWMKATLGELGVVSEWQATKQLVFEGRLPSGARVVWDVLLPRVAVEHATVARLPPQVEKHADVLEASSALQMGEQGFGLCVQGQGNTFRSESGVLVEISAHDVFSAIAAATVPDIAVRRFGRDTIELDGEVFVALDSCTPLPPWATWASELLREYWSSGTGEEVQIYLANSANLPAPLAFETERGQWFMAKPHHNGESQRVDVWQPVNQWASARCVWSSDPRSCAAAIAPSSPWRPMDQAVSKALVRLAAIGAAKSVKLQPPRELKVTIRLPQSNLVLLPRWRLDGLLPRAVVCRWSFWTHETSGDVLGFERGAPIDTPAVRRSAVDGVLVRVSDGARLWHLNMQLAATRNHVSALARLAPLTEWAIWVNETGEILDCACPLLGLDLITRFADGLLTFASDASRSVELDVPARVIELARPLPYWMLIRVAGNRECLIVPSPNARGQGWDVSKASLAASKTLREAWHSARAMRWCFERSVMPDSEGAEKMGCGVTLFEINPARTRLCPVNVTGALLLLSAFLASCDYASAADLIPLCAPGRAWADDESFAWELLAVSGAMDMHPEATAVRMSLLDAIHCSGCERAPEPPQGWQPLADARRYFACVKSHVRPALRLDEHAARAVLRASLASEREGGKLAHLAPMKQVDGAMPILPGLPLVGSRLLFSAFAASLSDDPKALEEVVPHPVHGGGGWTRLCSETPAFFARVLDAFADADLARGIQMPMWFAGAKPFPSLSKDVSAATASADAALRDLLASGSPDMAVLRLVEVARSGGTMDRAQAQILASWLYYSKQAVQGTAVWEATSFHVLAVCVASGRKLPALPPPPPSSQPWMQVARAFASDSPERTWLRAVVNAGLRLSQTRGWSEVFAGPVVVPTRNWAPVGQPISSGAPSWTAALPALARLGPCRLSHDLDWFLVHAPLMGSGALTHLGLTAVVDKAVSGGVAHLRLSSLYSSASSEEPVLGSEPGQVLPQALLESSSPLFNSASAKRARSQLEADLLHSTLAKDKTLSSLIVRHLGLTLSESQLALARAKVLEGALADRLDLDVLVAQVEAASGRFETAVRSWLRNPHDHYPALLPAMLLSIRLALTMRLLTEMDDLIAHVTSAKAKSSDEKSWRAESLARARRVAATLSTVRSHVSHDAATGSVAIDPTMLVVEYEGSLVLWSSQVETIRQCAASALRGDSLVQQMIMGAGKSSVVLPVLAAVLSQGDRVLVLAQPASLLAAARECTSKVLGGAFGRRVVTLDFNRSSVGSEDVEAGSAVAQTLQRALKGRSIVLATGASIKSLLLRFAETGIEGLPSHEPLRCSMALLREATIIMDEVDVLVHPLRSELNFPVGPKRPLALLDWRVAVASRCVNIALGQDVAGEVPEIRAVRAAIQQGLRDGWMERFPHVFVANESAFSSQVGPLLARAIAPDVLAELHHPDALLVPVDVNTVESSSCLDEKRFGPNWILDSLQADLAQAFFCSAEWPQQVTLTMALADKRTHVGAVDLRFRAQSTFLGKSGLSMLPSVIAVYVSHDEGVSWTMAAEAGEMASGRIYLTTSLDEDDNAALLVAKAKKAKGLRGLMASAFSRMRRQSKRPGAPALSASSSPSPTATHVRLVFEGPARWFAVEHVRILSWSVDAPNVRKLHADLVSRWLSNDFSAGDWDSLPPDCLDRLRVARDYVSKFVPHALCKIDGVSHGLIPDPPLQGPSPLVELTTADSADVRRLLSVPWLGKGVPSQSSEFAHPDVQILLTLLSARHSGLRRSDVARLLKHLKASVRLEPGALALRPSFLRWERWRGSAMPLHLLDVTADPRQLDQAWTECRSNAEAAECYLAEVAFPSALVTRSRKLTATGEDLAGLFKVRLGFSGTPNDALPLGMGPCLWERGTEATFLRTLTSPSVVREVRILPRDWTSASVLSAATTIAGCSAIIDAGGLVTGMSNEEAAQQLAKTVPGVKGCVFLRPSDDKKLVALRDGDGGTAESVALESAAISPKERFCLFDQVHSTGTDVPQPPAGCALLTLSKDVDLRDISQAAWRMRGLGANGQSLVFLVPPSVAALVDLELAGSEVAGASPASRIVAWLYAKSLRVAETRSEYVATALHPLARVRQARLAEALQSGIAEQRRGVVLECFASSTNTGRLSLGRGAVPLSLNERLAMEAEQQQEKEQDIEREVAGPPPAQPHIWSAPPLRHRVWALEDGLKGVNGASVIMSEASVPGAPRVKFALREPRLSCNLLFEGMVSRYRNANWALVATPDVLGVSLAEAASLRWMGMPKGAGLFVSHGSYGGWRPAAGGRLSAAKTNDAPLALLRFFDNAADFSEEEAVVLAEALGLIPHKERRRFFEATARFRRRANTPGRSDLAGVLWPPAPAGALI